MKIILFQHMYIYSNTTIHIHIGSTKRDCIRGDPSLPSPDLWRKPQIQDAHNNPTRRHLTAID